MYLKMQDTLLGWLAGRLQNKAKKKFWRVVVATTTGGFSKMLEKNKEDKHASNVTTRVS